METLRSMPHSKQKSRKIIIVGKNSYIGKNVRDNLLAAGHDVTEFDIQNSPITSDDLNGVDSVIHVAAIVHRKDISDYSKYEKVNVSLPYDVAEMAKKNGVKQFVFLSSMAVYGCEKSLSGNVINENTPCCAQSLYGKSKLEAERALSSLEDDSFQIAYVRPANVYGKACPGSYMSTFEKIVRKLPCIPVAYDSVKQGMLYIGNLCELIRLIVENDAAGTYPAQDKGGVSTVDVMSEISETLGLGKKKSVFFGLPFRLFKIAPVNKLYGGVVYDDEYAGTDLGDYNLYTFKQGMQKTFME